MGFRNPSAWPFAVLLAVLVALYLWERQRRRVDVPSLMLWEMVPDAIVRASRFRPDLLFLLQLLLLALLVAGLADPYFRGHVPGAGARRHIFVLDSSASMQAREGSFTRFEQARTALRHSLSSLPPSDEAMLITVAEPPQIVTTFSHNHRDLLARLARLHPTDTGADLNLALALAHRASKRSDLPTSIEVFTDVPQAQLAAEWQANTAVFQVGESDDNLAIESLQIFQGRFQDYRDVRAHVIVRNFAYRDAHGVLTLRLDDEVLQRLGFSLPPRGAHGFPVGAAPGPGILSAHLEVDDALASDNHAYGWIRPSNAIRVLAVSGPSPLLTELDLIARATPNLEFHFLAPADYHRGAEASYDIALFHRFVPDHDPVRASLYLFPATSSSWFTAHGEAGPLDILDWNESHRALRGLRPQLPFPLSRIQLLALPARADVLLTSRHDGREVPLAFSAERAGQRTAGIAFDLVADDLLSPDHTNLLVLFLNLLDWLAPSDTSVTVVHTGDVVTVADLPTIPRHVVDPKGRASGFPAHGALNLETPFAGEYAITANGTSHRVFANFFDTAESDIGRATEAQASEPQHHATGTQRGSAAPGFGPWLCALAAVLLLIEWFARAREA